MMRVKLNLDTMTDVVKFVNITSQFPFSVKIKDAGDICVNAKSLMGVLYSLEFSEIWCESEQDIYSSIKEFIAE